MIDDRANIKPWIIIVIIILVLIYLVTLGKADFFTEGNRERKIKLDEKKKILENRYKRVQDILIKKKTLKAKLEKLCKRVLLGVRLGLVLLLIGGIYAMHLFFNSHCLNWLNISD